MIKFFIGLIIGANFCVVLAALLAANDKDLAPADVIPAEWIREQIREQTFDSKVLSRMLRAWRAEQNEKRSPDLS